MKLAITDRIRRLFDRYAVRITIGAIFSLVVHGLILSLQLGLPGLGLPGIGFPWSERRAQTPELSVRIANLAGSSSAEQQTSPPPIPNDTPPKPQEAVAASDQSLTELPSAHVKQAPSRIAPIAPRSAKALKSSPAIAAALRKNGSPPQNDQSSPSPANAQVELITVGGERTNDVFNVPAPDPDSWWRPAPKTDSIPLPIQPQEEAAPPTIALQSQKQTIERAQEPAPALQKPSEAESFERPDEMTAMEAAPTKTQEVAAELAEHKEGEEIAAQENVRKVEEQEVAQRAQDEQTKKQDEARKEEEAARQMAEKKQQEAQLAQREQEAAEKKLEEEKQKKQEETERQAKEVAAHKQAEEKAAQEAAAVALQKQREAAQLEEIKRQEQAKLKQQAIELAARQQAEEIARQKALEIEKKKQEEQIAEQKKAQELAAAQKAEAEAAAKAEATAKADAQRENARVAAAAVAAANNSGTNNGNTGSSGSGNTGNQARGSGAGDLVSKALSQIGKIDMTRLAPLPNDTDHPEEDTRRRSIFGMVDHDVVVDAYIRGWRNKIERNGSLNYSQSSKDLARENPVVTVAIRSDGSVEDIVINRTSGRQDLDEAVKRIVRINAPYGKFPENLARKYPVIEIRRVWSFDETLKLLEEVH
jgi:TolA protein